MKEREHGNLQERERERERERGGGAGGEGGREGGDHGTYIQQNVTRCFDHFIFHKSKYMYQVTDCRVPVLLEITT